MNTFLYFVEGLSAIGIEKIREIGLGYAFDSTIARSHVSGSGPGGNQGIICAISDSRLGFYPDQQTWRRIPSSKVGHSQPVWVGFWNDGKPGPSDLARTEQLRGTTVKLKDNYEWLIPLSRSWTESESWQTTLPGVLEMDETGNLTSGGIERRYQALWDATLEWFAAKFEVAPNEQGKAIITVPKAFEWAMLALQQNYRIGPVEAISLKLFDDLGIKIGEVLDAMTDWKTFIEWAVKKNATLTPDGGLNSLAGEPDSIVTTVQLSSICG